MNPLVLNPITQGILQAILQAILNFLNSIGPTLVGPLTPLVALTGNTPLPMTADNPLVTTAWKVMLICADGFLLLFVLFGGIQMMIGQAIGSTYIPPREFLPRLFAVALAMHVSFIWFRALIIFNNELCGVVHASVRDFIIQVNGGQAPNGLQQAVLAAGLSAFFSTMILRYIFQSIERIVLLNLLFVLSPFGMLLFFLPQALPYATYWHRMYLVTCFLQFIQFLAFGLGFAFLAGSGMMGGLTGIIVGTGMMQLILQVPRLLYRLSMTAGSSGGGFSVLGFIQDAAGIAALFV
jgi:hypothetical protein